MAEDQEDGAVEYGGNNSGSTFEDMEEARNAPAAPDLSKITVEGDDIPDEFRGKSVAEIVAQAAGLKKGLEISEQARLALANSQEALAATRNGPAPAAPAAPAPEPELNEEQLQALFDESPRKYQEYLHQQTEKKLLGVVQRTIAPVVGNSADMTLREARSRYPDEFAAFGQDIQSFISTMPDKSALAAPGAVDELMDWMRGKHWKKFQEHLNSKNNNGLEDARDSMRRETPPDFTRNSSAPRSAAPRRGKVQLDDVQRQVAAAMNLSEEEYIQGMTPTRGNSRG